MIILCAPAVETILSHIYTDYSIAYAGQYFSESFLGWNYTFCTDVTNAITSTSVRYIGRTCTLRLMYFFSPRYGKIAIIINCVINIYVLRSVERQSNAERILKGLRSVPPSTFLSMPTVSVGISPRFIWTPPKGKSFVIPLRMSLLKGDHYKGLKVAYYNRKYTIVDSGGNPIVNKWFDKKPKFFKRPFGKYNVIAHVSYCNNLYAVSTDGQMFDLHRLWSDAYLSERHMTLLKRLITEAIRKHTLINESNNRIIRINEQQLYGIISDVLVRLTA